MCLCSLTWYGSCGAQTLGVVCLFFFFFFKQKTAYEVRISDWSSDVCSSDLVEQHRGAIEIAQTAQTVLFVGGFGPLHQIGKQNLGQLGGIVLGRRFERMEERGYSRGSTRLLKGDRKSTRLNSSH